LFRVIFGFSLIIFALCPTLSPLSSATLPLDQIPVGKVISINGLKFIKIADNKYQAVCEGIVISACDISHCETCSQKIPNRCFECQDGAVLSGDGSECLWLTGDTMQTWNDCASLPNPTCVSAGNCKTTTDKTTLFTQGPTLTDTRDGKTYEIRKFPDGKCWMVDNLRYGGSTADAAGVDYCNGKTAFNGNGSADKNGIWYGQVGANNAGNDGTMATLYGDCRDPHAGGSAPCASGSTQCGYYYNWQAAMQLPSAYYNVNVTYPSNTPSITNYIQGICPTGWHLPSGGTTEAASEFFTLDVAVGGTGANSQSGRSFTYFWKSTTANTVTATDPWKNIYSGYSGNSGGLSTQASRGYWWSSAENNATSAYGLNVSSSYVGPQNTSGKYNGFSVRCIKI
jgi:uncharacterized protein (TIGR02145 family)